MIVYKIGDRDIWELVHTPMEVDVRVSAVVVTCHTGQALQDCLYALKNDEQIHEVVIVDNGNPDTVQAWLRQLCGNEGKFRLVSGHGNVGFAGGANLGAYNASGDRLFFVNPDAVLRRGSIAALEKAREGQPEPCIVGGRVFNKDGSEQKGARRKLPRVWSSIATFADMRSLGRYNPARQGGVNLNKEPVPDAPMPTPAISGAMMYMSREAFDMLGGFDEGYFLHVEDIDICRRAVQVEDGSVIFTPLAGAMHLGGTSNRSKFGVEWEKAKGFGRYFRKFADGPVMRTMAFAVIPVIASLLFARIVLRSARSGDRSSG